MSINEEDSALFRQATEGVRRLKTEQRAESSSEKPNPKLLQSEEPPATAHWYEDPAGSSIPPDPVEAEAPLFYMRSQLPHTTVKRLKKGELCSNLELDLHGLTIKQAAAELRQLIDHASQQNTRCFHLIHGKGRRSSDQTPVLKSYVNQWLRQSPEVLAFCSARQRDGGTGALYVLLKKSARQ